MNYAFVGGKKRVNIQEKKQAEQRKTKEGKEQEGEGKQKVLAESKPLEVNTNVHQRSVYLLLARCSNKHRRCCCLQSR